MKIKGIRWNIVGLIAMLACALGGCGFVNSQEVAHSTAIIGDELVAMKAGVYDSEDTAIVVERDTAEGTIQLQNLQTGKRYTLTYDGTTKLYDKYNQAISMSQVSPGSIVKVQFYKPKKVLSYLTEIADAICYRNLDNYSIDISVGTISVGKTVYSFNQDLVVLSNEREIELESIHDVDVISVWGYNKQIYAINVEQGHGYLRLQNEDHFVGGWIEVGQKLIRTITEDMLIVVPEGAATVKISHKGNSATQEITFARDEEMAWDVGDVEITVAETGTVIFTMEPAEAEVWIDGEKTDVSDAITLDYGLHQLTAKADGYDTFSRYIRVAEPSAGLDLILEKSEEATDEEDTETENETEEETSVEDSEEKESKEQTKESSSATKDATQTVSATSGYRVYIDSPVGVEVYLDGSYLGIAPVNFAKVEGSYVVSLRKTGYQTRSYTLQIDEEEKNVNYSFSELMSLD